MGWGPNPGGGKIFHACPNQPQGPLSLVHRGLSSGSKSSSWGMVLTTHCPL